MPGLRAAADRPRSRAGTVGLREAVAVLRTQYGPPSPPPTSDPFELILWENVAYLASPARRREAFEELRKVVGTRPAQILAAPGATLERIAARGILKGAFAGKLRECARIAIEKFGGDLADVVRQPLEAARKSLRAFPGIGEPGAEKILLFSGRQALLAPESNALRVLVRLGRVEERPSYAQMYTAARAVADELPATVKARQEAHLLLQAHGQTVCRRSTPRCGECPLAGMCAYHRSEGRLPR